MSVNGFNAMQEFIVQGLSRYPQPTIFKPTSHTKSTFRQRLNDAVLWAVDNPQHSFSFDYNALLEIRKNFGIAEDEDGVYWGPRRYGRGKKSLAVSNLTKEKETFLTTPVDVKNEQILMALVLLKATQIIQGPVELINLNEQLAEQLENKFDVVFIHEATKSILI
jgi:hypothetical protein